MTTDAPWPDRLLFHLDRLGPVPLYHQLARCLEDTIRSGELPAGTVLENEIELAGRLHLSRGTVRHALQVLADDGLITRRRGSGTRVRRVA